MLIDKSENKKCRDCKGSCLLETQIGTSQHSLKTCGTCCGTGIYRDSHYIIHDNKVAIDSDFAGK